MNNEILLVVSTCPNRETADAIAYALVGERLAACVNILPGAVSVYEWQGSIERDEELVLLIKTRRGRLDEMTERLTQLHPYELPEVVAVPVTSGLSGYLEWVAQCTSGKD
jgi:periplasmic divalent cation tolerance protein